MLATASTEEAGLRAPFRAPHSVHARARHARACLARAWVGALSEVVRAPPVPCLRCSAPSSTRVGTLVRVLAHLCHGECVSVLRRADV
eukprot:6211342-Pleurochrysis_carterae.AAC.1